MIRELRSNKKIWAQHVADTVMINASQFYLKNIKEREHLGDLCVDERIVLKRILKK
jgi:hypothetical protein